jgi:hypothetical protein
MFASAKFINLDFLCHPNPEPGLYTYHKLNAGLLIYCISGDLEAQIHYFSGWKNFQDNKVFLNDPIVEIDINHYIRYSYTFIERYNKDIVYYIDGIQVNPGKLIYGILP